MPGKQRSPHLHRTPTMSLLRSAADAGCFPPAASFSQPVPECLLEEGGPCFPQDAASLHRELSPPSRQFELLDHMEICASVGDAFAMEGSTLSSAMVLDGSIEESLLASHAPQQYSLYPAHQALGLGQRHPIPIHQGAAQYYMNTAAHSKAMAFSQGSAQPLHFLDACFLCSKRLGHGKDVFMYRGDRAFCSAECRHAQIVADERREKCGQQTPAKERVGVTIPLWDGSLLA